MLEVSCGGATENSLGEGSRFCRQKTRRRKGAVFSRLMGRFVGWRDIVTVGLWYSQHRVVVLATDLEVADPS